MTDPRGTIFAVSVDSRGKSSSDMSCYKEHTRQADFFWSHIHENPKNICVRSQVAKMCGMDLKVYFHQHSPFHHTTKDDFHIFQPMCTNVNGIATLLTFNPETGYYNHLVFGRAYVILNDGKTPLSEQQVWGLVELIAEAKTLYHKDQHHISQQAHETLIQWTAQYRAQTWVPRCIYEVRQPHKPVYYRFESGMSDQATCHHGGVHIHHDGPHYHCCHRETEEDLWDMSTWDDLKGDADSAHQDRNFQNHHIIINPIHLEPPESENHTPTHHRRSKMH